MEKLAIFDVDFTLTKRETLLEFYIFMIGKHPKLILHAPKALFASILFLSGIFNAKKTKEIFISFINGISQSEMDSLAKEFYDTRLSKIFYRDAVNEIKKLKNNGFKIYLISASAEFYLKELYNINEVDKIIGTIFSVEKGKYSSKIVGENCKGHEKVIRLKNYLKSKNIDVDFDNSYMFSDSLSDLPLFNLVGNPYLINFRKKDSMGIKVLNWK
ncbi:HAD superfamily hydrolase (TIGR01490 family) [Clostridium algifaecis]|uniref:HAD superfamily hydrolase (TIGR01490 family) n=1 Tax=Clostridium algifaecis TaxID=1472040 RepID=A0ABS4KWF2_9CLOT|nr:HAD-IB family hydrolase [Clostridium algifaecis]MBP2033234.1 HAD superfamily hydrolase (TIGR01490 family) [Clostridium algifaecis]